MTMSRFPGSSRTGRLVASLGLSLALAVPAAATPQGVGLDLLPGGRRIVQAIPNVTLIGGKSCIARTTIVVNGTLPAGAEVDGIMRVFVEGVEAPYSPVFSSNGPIAPPAIPNEQNLNDTLNFIFIPPISNDVVLTFEVNPAGPGQIAEDDFSNNTSSTNSLVFECTDKPSVVYSPIDYRPGGGTTPNLPPLDLIEPGVGDNFIEAVYPTGDWDYFRTDAPSKLWTGNLSSSGSQLNQSLLSNLLAMSPQPDFIYGWVNGGLPYNGQAIGIPGRAAMGNTQPVRHQRTFAHELGHLHGRFHINNTTGVVGVDVEHQLLVTENLPIIKVPSLFDIMVAGLFTNQAWVYNVNWEAFFNYPTFQCPTEDSEGNDGLPKLLVGGLWNRETGAFELTDSFTLPSAKPYGLLPVSEGDLVMRVWSEGGLVGEFGIRANTSTDSCAGDSEGGLEPIAGFSVVLPGSIAPGSIERLTISEAAGGRQLTELNRSASVPRVELLSPRPSTVVNDRLDIQWRASDADGDALKHYIRYSPDGVRISPIAERLTGDRFTVDMAGMPKLRSEKGFFELLTSDGLNTSIVRTRNLLGGTLEDGGNPPVAYIGTPDAGKLFPKGATVILHCAAFDIEDRNLDGASVVWSSSQDGVIGQGRLTSTADLTVGGHFLTLTVTDSDGNVATDTTAITITDRELPGTVICQPDLGFGGPGNSNLMVCGGDLSTGTTADVLFTNGPVSQTVYLLSSDMNNPTVALGGTLVPIPVVNISGFLTDGNGDLTLPGAIIGGGGPATLYVQAAYVDFNQAQNFAFSNAVQVDILP